MSSIRNTPPGWIRLASSRTCHHKGPLPVEHLVRKHGELALHCGPIPAARLIRKHGGAGLISCDAFSGMTKVLSYLSAHNRDQKISSLTSASLKSLTNLLRPVFRVFSTAFNPPLNVDMVSPRA